jgi:hypothetical protein
VPNRTRREPEPGEITYESKVNAKCGNDAKCDPITNRRQKIRSLHKIQACSRSESADELGGKFCAFSIHVNARPALLLPGALHHVNSPKLHWLPQKGTFAPLFELALVAPGPGTLLRHGG